MFSGCLKPLRQPETQSDNSNLKGVPMPIPAKLKKRWDIYPILEDVLSATQNLSVSLRHNRKRAAGLSRHQTGKRVGQKLRANLRTARFPAPRRFQRFNVDVLHHQLHDGRRRNLQHHRLRIRREQIPQRLGIPCGKHPQLLVPCLRVQILRLFQHHRKLHLHMHEQKENKK